MHYVCPNGPDMYVWNQAIFWKMSDFITDLSNKGKISHEIKSNRLN
jgi:hypothetical protein